MILNIVNGNIRYANPADPMNVKKVEDLGIDYFTTQSAEEVLDDIITDLTSLQDELRIESSFPISTTITHNTRKIMSAVLDAPEQIEMFRYKTLLRGLRLETQGLQMSRGRSCYSIIKQEFGLKGSKQKVYDQFKLMLEQVDERAL